MGKFLVRITIIFTSIYFLIAFYVAQFYGIDIIYDYYAMMFELCVVVYSYSEGRYHCKFIKHLAASVLVTDFITCLDNSLNFLSVSEHNGFGFCCISIGMGMTLYEAIKHFHDVSKIKRKRAKLYGSNIDNKLRGIEYDKENGM